MKLSSKSYFDTKIYNEVPDVVFIIDDGGDVSVTNDAENVVEDLNNTINYKNRRILYKDSSGDWDELLHKNGKFIGFGLISLEDRQKYHKYLT